MVPWELMESVKATIEAENNQLVELKRELRGSRMEVAWASRRSWKI